MVECDDMELGKYDKVALCGFRNHGRKLLEFLKQSDVSVEYIIERNYEALRHLEKDINIPIIGFDEKQDVYQKADVIILSGDLPEQLVMECLTLAEIEVPVLAADGE